MFLFAFLPFQAEKTALSVVSYIGCGLSILGLIFTIFLHFAEPYVLEWQHALLSHELYLLSYAIEYICYLQEQFFCLHKHLVQVDCLLKQKPR